MDKNPHTNPMVTVAQTTVGADPKGARPGAPAATPGGGLPNPVVIIRRTLAHWPVAAVVMVLGVLATAQVVRSRKPIYKSETVIFYRPGVLSGDGAPQDVLRTLGTKLKETLLAQPNLKKVLDETHLYKDVVDKRGYSDAVAQLRNNIVFLARSNDTFAISFSGASREEAKKVTESLADMIVEENKRSRRERANERTEFLKDQKKHVDERLAEEAKKLAEFEAAHPEFVTDNGGRGGAAIRADQKKIGAAAEAARQAARRRLIAAGGAASSGRGGGVPAALIALGASPGPGAPPVDPVLLALRGQAMTELIAAKKDLSDKSLKFTEQHPDVRAAEQRVAAAEVALQKADDDIRAAAPPPPPPPPPPSVATTPDDPYDKTAKPDTPKPSTVAGGNPDEVKPKVPENDAGTLVDIETEWDKINHDVNELREQQRKLEGDLFRAQIDADSENFGYSATIEILDPAFMPAGPSGAPNRTIVMGGFVASLVIGIVLAAARGTLLDDRLFDASEVDGLGLVPVLGIVPKPLPEKKKTKSRRGSKQPGGASA